MRENGQVKYSDGEMRKMGFDELRSLLLSPSGQPAARVGADEAPAEEVMTPAGWALCACERAVADVLASSARVASALCSCVARELRSPNIKAECLTLFTLGGSSVKETRPRAATKALQNRG